MKLSKYAKEVGISYRTAWRWFMEDLVAIIYSFCARMYGQRRCKRKTEMIIQELNKEDELS